MLLVSTGRDGRGHGRERTAISHPSRRVAVGGPVERLVAPLFGFRALFSFPAAGGTPGWVGQWFCGWSGRSVLPGPRANVRGQPTFPGSPGSPGASVRECSGLRLLHRL